MFNIMGPNGRRCDGCHGAMSDTFKLTAYRVLNSKIQRAPLQLGVCQIIVMTMHRDSNFHDLLHRLLTPRIDY